MTRTEAQFVTLLDQLVSRVERLEASLAGLEARALEAERESARAWRSLDRLRAWRPCPACAPVGGACTIRCEACDDTGIAGVEPVHPGERVLA